jgi:EpsI family protein
MSLPADEPSGAPPVPAKFADNPFPFVPLALLALLFALIYGWGDNSLDPAAPGKSTIGFLLSRWKTDESVTHGWLVVPIALAVTWYKREKLAKVPLSSHPGGLWLIALALFLHIAEKALDLNGPSPLSLPIFAAGAVWYGCGTAWLRELAFPLAYLLFMIPVPGGLTQLVTFPLRLIATTGSKWIVEHVSPIQIAGSGMNMEFWRPGQSQSDPEKNFVALVVADPCSGIHSLMAIKALHAITAYLSRLRMGWKWLLFWCALPITLTANVCRMTLIILVSAYVDKKFGLTLFHDYSPYVLFLFVFLILVGLGRLLERLTGGDRWWLAQRNMEKERLDALKDQPDWQRIGRRPSAVVPALLLGVAAAISIALAIRPSAQASAADVTQLPLEIAEWRGVDRPIDDQTMKQQEADSFLYRRYVRPTGEVLDFMVVYRRYGRREFAHRPDQCYPAGGYIITQKDVTTLPWAGRDDPAVRLEADGHLVELGDGQRGVPDETVSYVFVSGNRSESDFLRQQLWMALERLMPNKNGWTFLRLSVPHIRRDGSSLTAEEAVAVQRDFLNAVGPELRRILTTDPETAGKEGP